MEGGKSVTASEIKDTIPVRTGEELNVERLSAYIRNKITDVPAEDLFVEQFPSGHSNLTYLLKIGDWEAVLRRPPLGPVAAKAHDMKRESAILQAIHAKFPLAPKPYVYEEDESIIGSAFFLMERRKGVVFDSEYPGEVAATKENGRIISDTMVKTLVDLHQIDYSKTDLVNMTKPEGFMERQVQSWIKRYEKVKTDEVPQFAQLKKWLLHHIPVNSESSIIHYDYKCNNAMFNPNDLTEMTGLFDWEMTTVGDPLADLGVTLSYWVEDSDPDFFKQAFGKPPITTKSGFYSRREFAQKYAEYTGRDLSNLSYYVTFAYFKLAVIVQQIYFRYKNGQTKDKRFAQFHMATAILISYANEIAKKGM